jgi:hypothetical protein
MAWIETTDAEVIVRLGTWEKLGSLRSDVVVPRARVTSVRVVRRPLSEVRGLRLPGTALPGVIALGTFRGRFGKDFVAVTREPAVAIELAGAPYARLLVSVADPYAVARRLDPST